MNKNKNKNMKQYEMFELNYHGPCPEESHVDVPLQAVFACSGDEQTVKGFYKGNGEYAVRFYPTQTGQYTYYVTGVVDDRGTVMCEPSGSHGIVRTKGLHFAYEDGTRYLPFGTTVYALAHQEQSLIEKTLETLKNAPFNKLRHCIFPKDYAYNKNEPEFYPFEKKEDGSWDVDRPCFAYWDHFEKILFCLGSMGIETDLILFHPYDRWGFSKLTMKECTTYLDYLLRRLAAVPYLWWSMANEYDLMFGRTLEEWYEIEEFIAANDPYHHLLSNHNCVKFYDFSRPNITHCCVQTIAMHMTDIWQEKFGKPVLYDECCYEGDLPYEWGNISGFEMVNRFWKACVRGAYATHGETFHAQDEVIWWAKGGALKGESPKRIDFLKELISDLPGPLETWNEPQYEEGEDPFAVIPEGEEIPPVQKLLNAMSEGDRMNLEWKNASYYGHSGKDVFLKYYAAQCVKNIVIRLPKDNQYKVELIDVWDMTRTTLTERACGTTQLVLPGKIGMAVLATKAKEL